MFTDFQSITRIAVTQVKKGFKVTKQTLAIQYQQLVRNDDYF